MTHYSVLNMKLHTLVVLDPYVAMLLPPKMKCLTLLSQPAETFKVMVLLSVDCLTNKQVERAYNGP